MRFRQVAEKRDGYLEMPSVGGNAGAVPLALVTGPTAGIGFSFSHALAAEGHNLVLVSRDEQRLGAVAHDLEQRYGVRCDVLAADLSSLEGAQRVEARLLAEPVDMLVNNAGFGFGLSFEHNEVEAEQAALDVMVRAPMRLCHAALTGMRPRRRGEIVNVASVAGFTSRGTYGAHKAWVISFSRWANIHLRKEGIRVMALCPGFVHTEFHKRMQADMSSVPDWMWLEADDVVREGLGDLRRGKAVSVPSLRYKALVGAARVGPNRLVERLVRRGR